MVVAFLQNQWFKNPERMQGIRSREPWLSAPRHKWNATWLFFGCLTGRRLQQVFGEELCDEIIWEEISPEIGRNSNSVFKADHDHIRLVLNEHKPKIVLAFGRPAENALRLIQSIDNPGWKLVVGPHPAARGNSIAGLKAMFEEFLQEKRSMLCEGKESEESQIQSDQPN